GAADPATVRGRARAWEAGPDGRYLLDRICAEAPRHLTPGGTLLMVHSALNGVASTLVSLREAGMRARVVARRREPLGPVMRARGRLRPGQAHEDLVVVRADRVGDAAGAVDRRPAGGAAGTAEAGAGGEGRGRQAA